MLPRLLRQNLTVICLSLYQRYATCSRQLKVRATVHIQLKTYDIAADAGVYQRKTEEMQKHVYRHDVKKPDSRSLAETQFNS